jgi:uncharacterized protein YbjT (DUF2867 family)
VNDKKIIAVVGATGAQGGGLVRAILADRSGQFAVRALTRDAGSDRAKELAAQGVDVVEADLDDEASLRKAFAGAYGAYVVTNFWEQRAPEQQRVRPAAQMELEQAGNAARAARDAGLRHVIWSTLADTRPYFSDHDQQATAVKGEYKVPHADAKAEANRFFIESGVPTTFMQANVYFEAFHDVFAPRRNEQGDLVLSLGFGDARVPAQAADDIGRTAYGVFRAGDAMIGRTVSVAGSVLTGRQYAQALSAALGEPVTYQPVDPDAIRTAGFPGAEELANMLAYFITAEKDIVDLIDEDLLRRLNPQLQPFNAWLELRRLDPQLDPFDAWQDVHKAGRRRA